MAPPRATAGPPPAPPVPLATSPFTLHPLSPLLAALTGGLLCLLIFLPRRVQPARTAHLLQRSARPNFAKPTPASNSGVPPSRPTSPLPRLGKALCSSGYTALGRLSPTSSPLPPGQLPRCHFPLCTRCCPLSVVPPREHHTDHLSLSPACVPRGLASTGPGRGGKGCLIAARRSAA